MEKLRDDLPVIANSARDVSNQIGNAGRTAHGQLDDMVRGFERLNEFGQASGNQVTALRDRIDEVLTVFEAQIGQMDELTTGRFAALREQSEAFRIELDGHEVDALADMRNRADMLHNEVEQARGALESSEEQALRLLGVRLGSLRDDAATIGNAIREQEEAALGRWADSIDKMQERLAEAVQTLARIDEQALDNSNAKLSALFSEAEAIDAKLTEREELFEARLIVRREELNRDTVAAVESLDAHFAELDRNIGQRREAQAIAASTVVDLSAEITAGLETFHTEIASIADQGERVEKKLGCQRRTSSDQIEREPRSYR